ncbi:7133_t:CDS:2 [Acaulospora morrowiae]|uniref:7133_t:CDS:1 n=1 Tax=Acaulospora morrowiae TaxID=94023 RepID=A0A9N8YV37_9GLOM|nr:7133_t:CDS:2 [Acaulospora morrowiae]
MDENDKELVRHFSLNHCFRYENRDFVPSEEIFDGGDLKLEKYTEQPLVYEPITESSQDTQYLPWDTFAKKFAVKNYDDFTVLGGTDIKLLIPVLKITYVGNPVESIKSSTNDFEFFLEKVLVGGSLIIRNFTKYSSDSLIIDQLKSYIKRGINEARFGPRDFFGSVDIYSKMLIDLQSSDGVTIRHVKDMINYLKKLYEYENLSIIAYEKIVCHMTNEVFDNRLIPGVTKNHKEMTIAEWLNDNIYLNLPYWINEYKLDHGLMATSEGFVPGTKSVIEFISMPLIHRCDQIEVKVTSSKDLLYDNRKIDLEKIPLLDISFDKIFKDVKCQIIRSTIGIKIFDKSVENMISRPSKKLLNDVKNALNSINPYKELTKVFSEYGHVFCPETTFGGHLTVSTYFPNYRENRSEIEKNFDEWKGSIVQIDQIKDIIKNWETLLINYDINVPKLANNVNMENIDIWLRDISKESYSWSLVDHTKLIPLYELFDQSTQREIQDLNNEEQKKVLMSGITKLFEGDIRYYRVEFEHALKSNDYDVIGSAITNDLRRDDLIVKFKSKNVSGFLIFIEKLNSENEENFKVIWQLIGNPKSVECFSKNTRKFKVLTGTKRKVKIPKSNQSLNIECESINGELSSDFLVATSVQYPPTNNEPLLQIIVDYWTSKKIHLQITNYTPGEQSSHVLCDIYWYAIDLNKEKTIVADVGIEDLSLDLIGFRKFSSEITGTVFSGLKRCCDDYPHTFESRLESSEAISNSLSDLIANIADLRLVDLLQEIEKRCADKHSKYYRILQIVFI